MKKNLMFFVLGVSTTLLMGAGISYWNDISRENKHAVLINDLGGSSYGTPDIPYNNKHAVLINDLGGSSYGTPNIPYNNKYAVLINDLGGSSYGTPNIPYNNKYALVWDGEIGNDAKKAMVVGFIHGMAVGREKAQEEAKKQVGY